MVFWSVLLQGVIPLGSTLAIPLGPRRSKAMWSSQLSCVALMLTAVALSGLWLALPWYLPWIMAALLAGAAIHGRKRLDGRWPTSKLGWVALIATVGVSLVLVAVSGKALLGRRPPPAAPVTVLFPLRGGPFLVAAGGSNSLVNPHLATLAQSFSAYRGQSYAVDLVGIGTWGSRSRGLVSPNPADYAIFGVTVVAPCEGTVVRSYDGAADNAVPIRSRDPIEGNHVIIECGDAWVVLAHLRAGSVLVDDGDALRSGTPIGQVGNSGQSDEPHLHVHAQTPGTQLQPISGEPLALRFQGKPWPVRNRRMTGSSDVAAVDARSRAGHQTELSPGR